MNPYVESVRPAWENPRYCFLDIRALETAAKNLATKELPLPSWRELVFPEEDSDQFIEFIGVANSINFCFSDFYTGTKFDVEYPKRSGIIWKGSFAMAASLKRALDERIPILDYGYLSVLSLKDANYIFRPISTLVPMIGERIRQLRTLGQVFLLKGMTFAALFREADYYAFRNGIGIVERLVQFGFYRDERVYSRTHKVSDIIYFHKRAQLLAMVYHGRAASSCDLPSLRDPEHIGPITDYAVPKTLRYLGALRYSEELASRVDKGKIIDEGSNMEIEIRAQTVHAMCVLLELVNRLRPSGKKITIAELDYALWSMSKGLPGLAHRTYTTAY